ncbi:NAD(P)-binding domain-containing protein [Streptomyces hydrogenans]|uniref:NAD(P)-binding domain-containing protein n=1 Tax=Streptomyces hydrogenans TaxID=1873719 RepID=UPI0038065098
MRASVVSSLLADDRAVAEEFIDSGVLARTQGGTVHVHLATVSAGLARRAHEVHAGHGVGQVAARVLGRVPAAEAGALHVLAAGEQGPIDRVRPLFDVIGSRTWRTGDRPERFDEANDHDIRLPVGELPRAVFAQAVADGGGADDWAVVVEQQQR